MSAVSMEYIWNFQNIYLGNIDTFEYIAGINEMASVCLRSKNGRKSVTLEIIGNSVA